MSNGTPPAPGSPGDQGSAALPSATNRSAAPFPVSKSRTGWVLGAGLVVIVVIVVAVLLAVRFTSS